MNDLNRIHQQIQQTLDETDKALNIQIGKKYDQEKADLTYLNPWAMAEISKAFEFGANKYGRYNYRKGMRWLRLSAAGLRHIYSWSWGEDKDPESGLSHLAHAGACIFMLLDYEFNKLGEDDRP